MATDYAAQIAAHNPLTLREAQTQREAMINAADSKAQREAIGDAWAPLARVE